jgi:hypothetical protein
MSDVIVFTDEEGSKIKVKPGQLKKTFDKEAKKAGLEDAREMAAAMMDGLKAAQEESDRRRQAALDAAHMKNKSWPIDGKTKQPFENVYKVDGIITGSHRKLTAEEKGTNTVVYAEDGHVTKAGASKYPVPKGITVPGTTFGASN